MSFYTTVNNSSVFAGSFSQEPPNILNVSVAFDGFLIKKIPGSFFKKAKNIAVPTFYAYNDINFDQAETKKYGKEKKFGRICFDLHNRSEYIARLVSVSQAAWDKEFAIAEKNHRDAPLKIDLRNLYLVIDKKALTDGKPTNERLLEFKLRKEAQYAGVKLSSEKKDGTQPLVG